MKQQEVYVSADCGGTGIEVKDQNGQLVMSDTVSLGLSQMLRYHLHSWQQWFDGVFNLFLADERYTALGDKFDEVGHRLAVRVAEELGAGYQVCYEPQGGWRLACPGPAVKMIVGPQGSQRRSP